MTPEEIGKTLDEAIIMLLNSTATKPQKEGIRERLDAVRKGMAVQAKMIELMAQDINRLKSELPVMPTNDDLRKTIGERYREQAEAELKGFNEANS